MRHGKKINHLSRKAGHRRAMLSNMASSLIEHKRINTTLAKAKALKQYIEPLITKSKNDTTHSRRVVFSYLGNKNAVAELFREVAVKVGDRPGGYTRIIKTGNRLGDNAEMAMIELVDFNELYTSEKTAKKKTTRRAGKKAAATEAPKKAEKPADVKEETPEEPKAEATEAKAEESNDNQAETKDDKKSE
ncbi:MAG: 50S ribosomal protein L17 [Bacteroidota bacterium]|nr:50S ribosomal protein L17 [Bacteroidota bacterium]MDX5427847.1 50S ribosomal protein L17 [Bacteroidota bacterium]MDX5448763.1 50S ribosomal protein L17 [Bacteroidota bacterium]MDX5505725.1 50S ribosomal protein L17 [Bacteroidota bacterium]